MLVRLIVLGIVLRWTSASNWIINGDYQYLINSKTKVTWDAAVKACKNEGAQIVIIKSVAEETFLTKSCDKCRFWVGLNRDITDETKFVWADNTPLNLNIISWARKEPRTGDCVEFDGGFLYTMNCEDINGYVCKKKYIPPTTLPPEPDPCTAHSLMSDDGSRASENDIQPTLLHCDHKLKTGWYKFESSSGNTMPTKCVQPLRCGTMEPIWMEGVLPTKTQGIVTRKACVSTTNNCCAFSWNIRVKQCSGFYVYYLPPTDKCFRAYCIGITKPPCPDCDLEKFPLLDKLPTLSWRIVNAQVEFVCDIQYEIKSRREFTFEVEWFADKEKIHQATLETNKLQAILQQKFLIGKIGKTFSCQVHGRFGIGPISPIKISIGFFAGIKILNTGSSITVKPGLGLGVIRFQLTIPLICPLGVNTCSLKIFTGLELKEKELSCSNKNKIDEAVIKCPVTSIDDAFCGIIITNENWNQVHEISIAATIHSQVTTIKKAILKLFCLDSSFAIWGSINININIEIIISGWVIINNICSSLNDPHMRTFDNLYYEHQFKGTFILYRNKKTYFEVQAYYDTCPGAPTVTCNCAVAIKSSDLLIIIDRCGRKGNMDPTGYPLETAASIKAIPIRIGKTNWKGTAVYRLDQGRKYQIVFPTGTYVDVTQSYGHLINIEIRSSAYDYDATEGLCGTFNGNQGDDFTLRDGKVACVSGKYCAPFSTNWQVSIHKGGLFQGTVISLVNYKEDIFCRCTIKNGRLPEKSCDFNNNIQTCQSAGKGKDITQWLKALGILRKRSVDHDFVEDNYLDDNWQVKYLKKRRKREAPLNQPIIEWTEEKARQYCKESLQKSSAGQFCGDVPNVDFSPKEDFCVLDILMSNTTDYVQSAVEAVKEECMTEIKRNSSLWVASKDPVTGEEVFIPPPDIEENLCINDCSSHGTCQKGTCKCEDGFMGNDCSVKSDEPPDVFYIPQGGLCAKDERQCLSTAVKGNNFVESDNLYCHLEQVTVNMPNAGYQSKGIPPAITQGTFESFGEVRCPIPITTKNVVDSWLVYISNDKKTKSLDGALFVAYNSQCIECKEEGMCTQKENTCSIGGSCYTAGQRNPLNSCQKCQPETSPTSWNADPECSSQRPTQSYTGLPPIITTQGPTTEAPFICPTQTDIYQHPTLCSHYIICKNWVPVSLACPLGLFYNPERRRCDILERVLDCSFGVWTKTKTK